MDNKIRGVQQGYSSPKQKKRKGKQLLPKVWNLVVLENMYTNTNF